MRVVLTIPDAFHKEIQKNYELWGFITINDFVLDCVRAREKELRTSPDELSTTYPQEHTDPTSPPQVATPPPLDPPLISNPVIEEDPGVVCPRCKEKEAGISGLSVHMANKHGQFFTDSQIEEMVKQNVPEESPAETGTIQSPVEVGRACFQCGNDRQGRATCPHCGAVDFS